MSKQLTKAQLNRQDGVDNACHQLLCDLAGNRDLDWDLEHIGEVRSAVQEVLVDKLHLMTEMEFYPYIEGEKPEHSIAEDLNLAKQLVEKHGLLMTVSVKGGQP